MRCEGLIVLLAALAGIGVTAGLGVWQLDRAAAKVALQAELDRRSAMPLLPEAELAREPAAARSQIQRRIVVHGRWDARHTVALDNRPMNERVGFDILTPLLLADGSAIVVQRGWLPRDFENRSRIALPPLPTGTVALAGRLEDGPARLHALGDDGHGLIRQNLELDAFARETGLRLRPLIVLQAPPPSPDGLRRDWAAPAARVAVHYGYAFQWFALGALILGLYVWFRILRPRRRP